MTLTDDYNTCERYYNRVTPSEPCPCGCVSSLAEQAQP